MISPRTPLIVLVAVIVSPGLTVVGVAPSFAIFAVIAVAVVFVVALADAIFFAPRFDALRIVVGEVIRLSKNREGKIDFLFARCVEMEGGAPATPRSRELAPPFQFRVGLPLPPEVGATSNEFDITFLPGTSRQSLSISCQPTQRGRVIFENAFVQ